MTAQARIVESLVFVTRARTGDVLLMHRCDAHGGFWHAVSGTVEEGETFEDAARRELREEVGLEMNCAFDRGRRVSYLYERPVGADSAVARVVTVECFRITVGDDFVPILNWEHDRYMWCEPCRATELLHWPNVGDALVRLLYGRSRSRANEPAQKGGVHQT